MYHKEVTELGNKVKTVVNPAHCISTHSFKHQPMTTAIEEQDVVWFNLFKWGVVRKEVDVKKGPEIIIYGNQFIDGSVMVTLEPVLEV